MGARSPERLIGPVLLNVYRNKTIRYSNDIYIQQSVQILGVNNVLLEHVYVLQMVVNMTYE